MKPVPRNRKLKLLVTDSGRTWSVLYQAINSIPPDTVQLGDVFIVHHSTEPGVMFLQATSPKTNGWVLEALGFE